MYTKFSEIMILFPFCPNHNNHKFFDKLIFFLALGHDKFWLAMKALELHKTNREGDRERSSFLFRCWFFSYFGQCDVKFVAELFSLLQLFWGWRDKKTDCDNWRDEKLGQCVLARHQPTTEGWRMKLGLVPDDLEISNESLQKCYHLG